MEPLRYNEVSEGDIFDFVRCQRADGSFYGTSGTCRKGVQVGPKEKAALKKAAKAGNKKAEVALAVVEGKMTKAQAKKELGGGGEAKKAKAVEKIKPAKKKTEKAAVEDKKKEEKKTKPKKTATKKKSPDKKEDKKAAAGGTGEEQAAKQRERLNKKKGREEVLQERNAEYKKFAEQAAGEPPEKSISRKSEKAIFDYTRDRPPSDPTSYSNMNGCSRNPPSCTSAAQKANASFDSALKDAPANTGGGAYFRGMNLTDRPELASQLENLKVGDTFADPGFGSYSRSPQSATTFLGDRNNAQTRNIMMISRSKNIRSIENYSDWPDELEGVLPRNTSQTVRSVRHVGNTTYIEVD